LEVKWKGLFQFLPTRIFWITFRDGLLISIKKIWLKFSIPFLTNQLSFYTSLHVYGNLEKESKNGTGEFLLVSKNFIPFSFGIPTGLWPVSLALWKAGLFSKISTHVATTQ